MNLNSEAVQEVKKAIRLDPDDPGHISVLAKSIHQWVKKPQR